MAENKLYFRNQDGLLLCGILAKPTAPTTKCVLLCHGLTGNGKGGEIFDELAWRLIEVGIASFRFDFRGQGESEGSYNDITLSGEQKDIEAAVRFIKPMGYRNLGITAADFAAGPVCFYLRENAESAKALVFWNPILEYSWLFNSNLIWARANFGAEALAKLARQGYLEISQRSLKIGRNFINEMRWLRPLECAKNILIPTLFVKGDKDSILPADHLIKYASFFKNVQITTIAEAEHSFQDNLLVAEKAAQATKKFFLEKL